LWLLAGEDTSLPTPETAEDLAALKSQGLPIDFTVYPGAEHGNVMYTTDAEGKRTYTHYVESYFQDVVNYFQQQNDVAPKR
jgi:dienelactone hydrolase